MFKKNLTVLTIALASSYASAEIRPYLNADIGFADTDFDSGIYFDVGGGIQFNEHVEFEVAYNNYGEIGPFETDVTSYSYGLNIGGKVSDTTKIFAILGAERLEIDDTVSLGFYTVEVDESSTEAFFGIGAAFQQSENFDIRTKLISHDSGDLITLSLGIAFLF